MIYGYYELSQARYFASLAHLRRSRGKTVPAKLAMVDEKKPSTIRRLVAVVVSIGVINILIDGCKFILKRALSPVTNAVYGNPDPYPALFKSNNSLFLL